LLPPFVRRIAFYPVPARVGIFILTLLAGWLPFAIPLYFSLSRQPNLATILTMGALFVVFLFLLRWWNQKIYQNPHWLKHYGLDWTRHNRINLLKGLGIGLLLTLTLLVLESLFGWVRINPPSLFWLQVIAEGLLSALGIGFAEELLFRGWLLDELERDYASKTALWINAVIFALLHFLKPVGEILRTLPSFPALILLGLILVWAKRGHSQSLGICIGLHAGLVWGYYSLNVGQIVQYTQQVSPFITGIDGNPLAGAMGLFLLGMLALWMRKPANQSVGSSRFR
jgi:membrane protease YdiL (CAAX protease family)